MAQKFLDARIFKVLVFLLKSLALVVLSCQIYAGDITNVAGDGTAGFSGDNGPATAAQLDNPFDVVEDSNGNLFISDFSNHRVRKIDAAGTITTVAGTGVSGFSGDNCPGTSAQLYYPNGLAVDTDGNLFIADQRNNRIRKLMTDGTITTVAGTGTAGFSGDNGQATSAQINDPFDIEVDSSGNLYIADKSNNRVRKVATNGVITTIAGDGTSGFSGDGGAATSAQLNQPHSVAIDSNSNLFIADRFNHRIRKVDAGGTITTVAGNGTYGFSGDNGPATSAALAQTQRLAVDSKGNLFMADVFNYRVRKVDTAGIITTVAGTGVNSYSGDNGPSTSANIGRAYGVAVDSNDDVLVADSGNDRIRRFTPPVLNSLPTITSTPVTAATEDSVYTYTLIASDTDTGDTLTLSAPTLPSWLSFTPATGVLTGTPSNDEVGNHNVVLRVTDGTTDVDQSFTITVSNTNDAPTVTSTAVTSVNEDATYTYTLTTTDIDVGDTFTLSAPTLPTWLSFTPATGVLTGTPSNDEVGNHNVVLRVNDGTADVDQSFTITVNNTNDVSTVTSTPVTAVNEDSAYTYTFSATDIDIGDTLTLSAATLPAWLSFTPATGVLTGTPSNDEVGNHNVVLRVNDGTVDVDQGFTITVTNTNDAPTINATPKTAAVEGVAYSFSVTGNDVDTGDTLSYQISNNPAWLSINSTTGLVSGTPSSADVGVASNIIVSVSDGTASSALSAFSITVDSDLDGDSIGDATDADIDGDGMSNEYEEANGLDPRDASDAALDLDGDGISNLDEFNNQSDPTIDDYGPLITGESLVTINAVALLTDLPANLVSANDALEGEVSVTHNLASELLAPGEHVITWTANDSRNNTSTFEQTLHIQPIANWQVSQVTGEDNTVSVSLFLNGPAPIYPVVAEYTVSGSATNPGDHDAVSGILTINEGQNASLNVAIVGDEISENEETILFTLDSISHATKGVQQVHEITISEVNHAPKVNLTAALDSAPAKVVTLLSTSDGLTTLTANVNDPDTGDSHSFVWKGVSNLAGTATGNTYQFDPATAGAGVYQLSVTATDDAASPLSGSALLTLKVVAEAPVLSALEDSDSDGIDDSTEGLGDSDGDNVPDFADSSAEENVLAMFPLGNKPVEGAWKLEAQAGMRLKLNVYANRQGDYSPVLEKEEIVDENEVDQSDSGYIFDGGIFDFVISDMPVAGETVFVVLPQLNPIPAEAVYRKERDGRWTDFEEDANNFITSAPGRLGTCPPPGSTDYQLGLNEGDYCVQLGIEDGGANDTDGEANGTIVDPGGVGQGIPNDVRTSGGAMNVYTLLLMAFASLCIVFRRQTRLAVKGA